MLMQDESCHIEVLSPHYGTKSTVPKQDLMQVLKMQSFVGIAAGITEMISSLAE
jgi:hypothetical protein